MHPIPAGKKHEDLLDYVPRSTRMDVSATTAAGADTFITGNEFTVDGNTETCVEFFTPFLSSTQFVAVDLWDNGTDLGVIYQSNAVNAGAYTPYYYTPSTGKHTLIIKTWRGTGTASFENSVGGAGVRIPAYLRVTVA